MTTPASHGGRRSLPLVVIGAAASRPLPLTDQLRLRGYDTAWVAGLPLPTPLPAADLLLFALPIAQSEAVVQACAQLRALDAPMTLVLHPSADPDAAVRILEAGADDCLLAPHNPREVVARVRALIRRRDRDRAPKVRLSRLGGDCLVDPLNLRIRAPDGREASLTPLQHRLLSALMSRPGEVLSREYLMEQVLGEETDSFDRAIDVHVSRLRKRLAQVSEAELITSCRGVGYRLDAPAP